MINLLTEPERARLNEHIVEAEKKTGAQIVLSIIKRSDSYPELPWKAFALGAAVSGFIVSLMALGRPSWEMMALVLTPIVVTLAGGGIASLLCIFVPRFARFFLDHHRAELETQEYAKRFFLSHELFATKKRTGILLLVSLFEQQVVVLPDSGLQKCLPPESLHAIIGSMKPALASKRVADAFEEGIKKLEVLLSTKKRAKSCRNELSNEIIEEKGL